MPQEEQQNINK